MHIHESTFITQGTLDDIVYMFYEAREHDMNDI